MSLWYDIKKKSYAYDAKESWLRSYADKIVSALKTELLEKLGEHFAGKLGRHSAAEVKCTDGESVQTALDIESANRIAGDSTITSLVTAEEKARISGDNEIKSLVSAEERARISALELKVDKVNGKNLSTNDYSDADKLKLSQIEAGAQVNSVTSVAGKTGAVTLSKSDVGLSSVNNTSDMDKPVSTATLAELEKKANISDVLTKNNTVAFSPSGSYSPATKKYVDEQVVSAASGGTINLSGYITKDNAEKFTPTGDYNPATKKYVDDNSISKLITDELGVVIGTDAYTYGGVALGLDAASVSHGSAIGNTAFALKTGGAIGFMARTDGGGAVGGESMSGDGFAGGYKARTGTGSSPIDAIQLGTGTNANKKTLQIYDYQLLDADGNIPKERLKNAAGTAPPTLTAVTQNDTSASSADWTGTGFFCKNSERYVANPSNDLDIKGYYRFCLRPETASDKECMLWTPYYVIGDSRYEFFYSPARGLYETLISPTNATPQEIVDNIVWEFAPPTILKYGKLSNAIRYTLKEDGTSLDKFTIAPEMYIRDSSGNIGSSDVDICAFLSAQVITLPYDLDLNLCTLLHLIADTEGDGDCSVYSVTAMTRIVDCLSNTLTIETIDGFNA